MYVRIIAIILHTLPLCKDNDYAMLCYCTKFVGYMSYVPLVNIELRYTRGRMAQCYHKACDGWDPSTRSPESPRFLAAVTRAVLDSVLEMAEEDVVNEDTAEVEADKEDMNKVSQISSIDTIMNHQEPEEGRNPLLPKLLPLLPSK